MIQVYKSTSEKGSIWIGNSGDERGDNLSGNGIGAILCVSQDMWPTHCWADGYETGHVGLIDGPGNTITMYCAAILALHNLLTRNSVLLCCHDGGRSVAVALMYLSLREGCIKERVDFLRRRSWEEVFMIMVDKVGKLPIPHKVHIEAFSKIPFGILETLL